MDKLEVLKSLKKSGIEYVAVFVLPDHERRLSFFDANCDSLSSGVADTETLRLIYWGYMHDIFTGNRIHPIYRLIQKLETRQKSHAEQRS